MPARVDTNVRRNLEKHKRTRDCLSAGGRGPSHAGLSVCGWQGAVARGTVCLRVAGGRRTRDCLSAGGRGPSHAGLSVCGWQGAVARGTVCLRVAGGRRTRDCLSAGGRGPSHAGLSVCGWQGAVALTLGSVLRATIPHYVILIGRYRVQPIFNGR